MLVLDTDLIGAWGFIFRRVTAAKPRRGTQKKSAHRTAVSCS